MSLTELIKQRRTIYQFQEKPVSSTLIESFIEAAIHAPNHKLTEPWKFLMIGSKTQNSLAEVYAQKRALKHHDEGTEGYKQAYEKSLNKFLAIPTMVFFVQQLGEDPVTTKEDYAACSCAIQNFQLAAWEQGVGVQWSSGPILKDERTFEMLGLDFDKHELIAALYMGYPKAVGSTKRKAVFEVIEYFD